MRYADENMTGTISTYVVSLEDQKVRVTGSITYDVLVEKIKKTGKKVIFRIKLAKKLH